MSEPQRLIFAPFLLDLRDERLWQEHEAVRLGSKAFAILRCLVAHAGQLVTKDTLLQTVWPETAVHEAVLTVVMGELRRALGDQARRPQFIETVHGRGYRFIAPVAVDTASVDKHAGDVSLYPPPLPPGRPAIFVGRDSECAQLQQWFAKALQGERQMGFIAGEPGIGKTALVDTFVAHLTATTHVWVGYGQCIDHYGAGEAYLPVLEALARLCRGPDADHLVTLLRQYAPSWLVQMPGLLSPAERETLGRSMSGVTQARMLRELAEALDVLTAMRPLVLVVEDLHWSDPSTLAFLTYVARRRDWARLLVLGTYRPAEVIRQAHPLRQVIAELRQHHRCVYMTLASLPEAAITAYVRERFGAKTVPEGLVRFLYQRSSGNPLFFTALIDELRHRGILEESRATVSVREGMAAIRGIVPDSLHLLITQQVEQLSSEDQAILEAASVAGMTFSVAAVAAAVELAMSTIEARCATWARQGWLVQDHGTETWPDGTVAACYGFRHALYHEVILARISPGQRIHLHDHIGNRKERAYADQTQAIAAELAVHFEQAREMQRAVLYRHKAAETALQRSAYEEAIAHLIQGLTLLNTLPNTPERAQHELALNLALGGPLAVTKGYAAPEVAQVYTRARELYHQLGATAQLSTVAGRLWQFYIVWGELQTARELGEECLHLAGDDATSLLVAHYALALCLFYLGEFAQTRWHAEHGAALYDAQHHHALASLYGYDLGMGFLGNAAQALWMLGYPDQAQQRCQEALTLAQQLSHPFSVACGLGFRAVLHQFRREGQGACDSAEELISFCTERGFSQWVAMGTILRGWGLAAQGQDEVGIALMREGLLSSQNAGTKLGQAPVLAQLAEVYWRTEQTAAGLQALTEALAVMDTTSERWWAAETYRLKGDLLLQQDVLDVSGAETCFQHALDIARQQHAKSWELRAATSLARLWQGQDKRAEAHALLAPIYGWFTEGFDTADLQEANALLDALA
jgi:DNA-binding winged helix-turn-helix (wHTH) protein/predicted ATPase